MKTAKRFVLCCLGIPLLLACTDTESQPLTPETAGEAAIHQSLEGTQTVGRSVASSRALYTEGGRIYPVYRDGTWHYPPGTDPEAIAEALARGERSDARRRGNRRGVSFDGWRWDPVYRDGTWHYPPEVVAGVGAEAIAEALAKGERSDAFERAELARWNPKLEDIARFGLKPEDIGWEVRR